MRKWREHAPRMLFESALIVFSILLALALDEWRQERRAEAQLQEARAAFVEEIRQNLTLVQHADHLPRRRLLWDRFTELSGVASPTPHDIGRIWDELGSGVRPTPYRDAVWRSLSTADVLSRMPYDELFLLSDIYREQQEVRRWHDRMFDAWSVPRSDRLDPEFIRDDIQRTRSYLADVVAAEIRLIRSYEQALERFAGSTY